MSAMSSPSPSAKPRVPSRSRAHLVLVFATLLFATGCGRDDAGSKKPVPAAKEEAKQEAKGPRTLVLPTPVGLPPEMVAQGIKDGSFDGTNAYWIDPRLAGIGYTIHIRDARLVAVETSELTVGSKKGRLRFEVRDGRIYGIVADEMSDAFVADLERKGK